MFTVVLVSGVQKSDSVIYTYIPSDSSLLLLLLLQITNFIINIEYSSLCYTVDPCWLFTLYMVVCIY